MRVVTRDLLPKEPIGTMYIPFNKDNNMDIPVGGGPAIIMEKANDHISSVATLEPYPGIDGRYGNGKASFGAIPISELDYGENTKFLVLSTYDKCIVISLLLYSITGNEVFIGDVE